MSESDFCGLCGTDVLDIDQKCPNCGADLASTAARRLIGTFLLSDYEVLEVLGQGGMAVVYRGRHRVTGQEVALKVLPPDLATRKEIRSRFVEEARALAQLDHPNIVHLYNFDADEGSFVLAMQLADGPTWERLILEKQIDWRRSIELAIQVCSALDYAHQRGIVHRDMKPSNVLIRRTDGTAMVMDFGIAKGASDSRLTATGQTMGTVRYMSPEQVRGREVDKRSDIYSLAVTLYESVAGKTPFEGDTHFEIMSAHLKSIAVPLASRIASIPRSLSDVVAWAMSKRPEERPASAADFARALEQVLAGKAPAIPKAVASSELAITPTGDTDADAPRARAPLIALAIALVVVVASAGFLVATRLVGDDANTPTAADATIEAVPAPPQKPSAPILPSGIVLGAEQRFKNNLRLLLSDGVEPEPYIKAYEAGLERWRRFLAARGLAADAEFNRPMPEALIIVAPADLLCERDGFADKAAWTECLQVGSVQRAAHALLLPDTIKSPGTAIASFVSVVYCGPKASKRCSGAAIDFQQEIFR